MTPARPAASDHTRSSVGRAYEWPEISGYQVLAQAGSGGMGRVFCALATKSGRKVAIKVLRSELDGTSAETRLLQEAQALAELSHPAIVEYVDHGITLAGHPYLVMEWLDGDDLEQVLSQRRLSIDEVLALASQVAGCLAAAHERHIIHRDIKPANVFLVAGAAEQARILDFGIAQILTHERRSPHASALVGTPGYMSPEQARGEAGVDQRSDLFSLGCLLYECVTGRPAFAGKQVMAVLAKVLLEQPPHVADLVADLPPALELLIEELLQKDAAARPRTALEVQARLLAINVDHQPRTRAPRPAITRHEQVFHSVLLCRGEFPVAPVETGSWAETLTDLPCVVDNPFGEVVTLVDGTHLLVMARGAAISDQANNAASSALALRAKLNDLSIAVVSGRAELTGDALIGEILDRGAALLINTAPGSIRIGDVTASLLESEFELRGDERGLLLVDTTSHAQARAVIDEPAKMVGRRRELAVIEALANTSVEQCRAGAVLVVGEAGIGKSRLRKEFELRRGQANAAVGVLGVRISGRCDEMSFGAPFALLARLIRELARITDGESPQVKRRKLRARLSRQLPPGDIDRVLLYLAELLSPAEHPPAELLVAREHAVLMRERIVDAWVRWLRAECEAGPVLLIIEDLHWCDNASVRLLESMMCALEHAPLFILAMARSVSSERFGGLIEHDSVEIVELPPLPTSAARKLLRNTSGEPLTDHDAARFIDAAGGNPLFLEELVRTIARGQIHSLPATVFGMIERRLTALSIDERRVLRAASVFGEVFWAGGVRTLVGELPPEPLLARLVAGEWLVVAPRSRIADETEYGFRHALVRDATYASLTEVDRRLAHRLAAQWLEPKHSSEAVRIAEHYRLGEATEQATQWFATAADQAFDRYDFDAVVGLIARIVDDAPTGEARGRLLLRRAEVLAAQGKHLAASDSAFEALRELPEYSPRWCAAVGEAALGSARSGNSERVVELTERIAGFEATAEGGGEHLLGLVTAVVPLATAGAGANTAKILARIIAVITKLAQTDPGARGPMHSARALEAITQAAISTAYEQMSAASLAFEAVGSLRWALEMSGGAGFFCLEIGALERGEALLRENIRRSSEVGLEHLSAVARHNLGRRLGEAGRVDEALELELAALHSFEAHGNHRMHGLTLAHIAWNLLLDGRSDEALARADAATERLEGETASLIIALATRAQIHLQRGETAAAEADARRAIDGLERLDRVQEGESLIRLTWAEARAAVGDLVGARSAILTARRSVEERASMIAQAQLRESFWALPENAKIDALAREWLA